MTTQQVSFTTKICLECKEITNPSVILCVSSNLVAQHLCPEGGTTPETDFVWSYIEGILTASKVLGGCGSCFFNYTFQYDDDQLIEDAQLTSGDIFGVFCLDCLAQYVQDVVGDESYIRYNEDGSVTFISQHGCEYDFIGSMPFQEAECPSDYFVGAPDGEEIEV